MSQSIALPPQDRANAAAGLDRVRRTILGAADAAGVDFSHLLKTAEAESGLETRARSTQSSAQGLFQFVERTWLDLIRRRGAEIGLSAQAAQITHGPHGPEVTDARARAAILDLRNDPEIASAAAALFTRENAAYLEARRGGPVSGGALYAAHLLGPGGAEKLLAAVETKADLGAASLLPAAAAANHRLFYDQGRPLSVEAFLARLEARFGAGPAGAASLAAPAAKTAGSLIPADGAQPAAAGAPKPDPHLLALLILQDVRASALDRLSGHAAASAYDSAEQTLLRVVEDRRA